MNGVAFPALGIDDFIHQTWVELEAGRETIAIGSALPRVEAVESVRAELFEALDSRVKDIPGMPADRA
jgi:hypothetical protein